MTKQTKRTKRRARVAREWWVFKWMLDPAAQVGIEERAQLTGGELVKVREIISKPARGRGKK